MNSIFTTQELDCLQLSDSVKCNIQDLPNHCVSIPRSIRKLTVVSQNIASIYKNLDDLLVTLSELDCVLDIIVITECRLDPNKNIPLIQNYTNYQTTKLLNQNDGVVVYINNMHRARVTELNLLDATGLQVEIANTVLLGIYRSPSILDADRFVSSLNSQLETITHYKSIVVTGDININLLPTDTEKSQHRRNRLSYLNVLALHGLLPGHCLPTRLNSCLDHFMLKLDLNLNKPFVAVLNTTITDHNLILLYLSYTPTHKPVTRSKLIIDFDGACKTLLSIDFPCIDTFSGAEDFANYLIETIRSAIQSNSKIIRFSNNKKILKPWLTAGTLKCIRLRNSMQLKLRKDPHNIILSITYKRFRNYCSNLINKLKRNYHSEQIRNSVRDPRKFWSTVNDIVRYKPAKTGSVALLNLKSSPLDSVNFVNTFFAQIGAELASIVAQQSNHSMYGSIPSTSNSFQLSSFVLLNTDQAEVNSILSSLDSNSAPGWDGISTGFLKHAREIVVPHICKLANLCFDTGVFPSSLKRSIVTPVFKSGDRTNVNDYRPISVLTSVSKIIEKLLNKRLVDYLDKFKILSSSQYGFRKGLSTQDAILDLTTTITEDVDRGDRSLTVFLDLKKAFDTVSVPILLKRLENIGIRGVPHLLLASYLRNRTQEVKIDDYHSEKANVTFGVPQGSVLGPTLFLIYINDLCNLRDVGGRIISYADDTAIVFTDRTWEAAQSRAERGLLIVSNWLKDNLLTLNTQKTNYICFSPSIKTQPSNNFKIGIHHCRNNRNVNCSCSPLNRVTQVKYLGVILDQRLVWYPHIEHLIDRTRKLMWVFKVLRQVMSNSLKNKLYIALAQSVLTYCISVWGGTCKTHVLGLERAQRSLIKVIYSKPYRFPTDSLYKLSGLLSIRKLYVLSLILNCHKSHAYVNLAHKRRKHVVARVARLRTAFARRQYIGQSAFIYNKINKILDLYPMLPRLCRKTVVLWLTTLKYDEVENLFMRNR